MLCLDCLRIPKALQTIQEGGSLVEPDFETKLFAQLQGLELSMIWRPNADYLLPANFRLVLKPSVESLKASATEGCPGCCFWLKSTPPELTSSNNVEIVLSSRNEAFRLHDENDESLIYLEFEARKNDKKKEYQSSSLVFEICASQGMLAEMLEKAES